MNLLSRDHRSPVNSYQEIIAKHNKMLEYLNFCLIRALFTLIFYPYAQVKRYLPLLKMAEELIGNLGYGAPQSDTKHQKLLECVLTRNSKLYLGKAYTEDQLAKLSKEEVKKLFNNYEAMLSGQMVKSLGHSIINMYSMGACATLGISNQHALSEDLENDPFLNSALQRFTCKLYYRFGSFLAPLSIGIITSRQYLYERIKNGERTSGTIATGEQRPQRELLSSIGLFIGMGLLGFWFRVGAALGSKMINSLEELITIK